MKRRHLRRAAAVAARAAMPAGAMVGVMVGAIVGAIVWALCLPPSPAAAQERSWLIESFHADIRVLENGSLEVIETIRPRFDGSYNGIYRTIPVEYRSNRFRYKLRLSVEAVTDADGNPLRYETKRDGDYLNTKIWVPGAVDAARTVRLSYGVTNGLRFFAADEGEDGIVEAYDELYWNVTGTEWPVPIETASATVSLPQAVEGVRAHAFTGGYGATGQDAAVDVTGSRVDVRTDGPLGFREGLTIGIGWDAGVVRRPTAIDLASMYLFANWPLFLPFFALAFMYRRWNERGRDPEIGSIEPRYEPPGDLTPAEVGVIIDNRADLRDITATLIDLAVRGHLSIEERGEKDYLFERRDTAGDPLAPHESALLRSVFGGRTTRRLSDLKDRFYKDLPELKSTLLATLIEHGVYTESPAMVRGKYVGLGFLVGIVIFFGGLLVQVQAVLPLAMPAVLAAAVASALVIMIFGLFMPARTKRGTELLRQVKGFEEFLTRVESDRYRRKITGPEMFEKCLPYAMALGVAAQWARAFRDLYREPPDWYHGHALSTFNSHILVSNLNSMSAETHSVMQSAPRSAQSSSFPGGGISGGGGFSGGGFGGGGGGAF